ncbi:MAG: Asp-tRNA(Asn)/Glu-tRNA(Gln) amidotransferase subunit GatC [Candidatus Micrarchaeia archaeon]|jgi:aspartyl/glutamyl-tRNA(Asn/Gln) amidotransferase C subunit
MDKITKVELAKAAEVARLQFSERELEALEKDAAEILEYLAKVREIKESGSETHYLSNSKNPLRKDKAKECGAAAEIRKQFNSEEEQFLLAPKTL